MDKNNTYFPSTFIKQTFIYLAWSLLALIMGFTYMRFILGPSEATTDGWGFLIHIFYVHALLYTGLIVGAVIAILFILLDVFSLKKRLKDNPKSTVVRFLLMLLITVVVIIIHYILEKVIDVI